MTEYSETLEQQLKQQAERDGVHKLVVGAVILNQDQSAVLLLKRHPSDFMPNLDELPSGGVGKTETFSEALIREVKEETGLDVTRIGVYINHFDYHSQSGRLSRQFNFVVETGKFEPVILSPNEHSSYLWNPLARVSHITHKMKEIIALVSAHVKTQLTD